MVHALSCRRTGTALLMAMRHLIYLLGLIPFLVSCSVENDDRLSPPPIVTPELEQRAVASLLSLYPEAMRHADIDRLQDLLQVDTASRAAQRPPCQDHRETAAGIEQFCAEMARLFRERTVIDIQVDQTAIAPDRRSVSFREAVSVVNPDDFAQQTQVFHTTLNLALVMENNIPMMRIAGVERQGPLFEINTPGRVLAGELARVTVQPMRVGTAQPVEVTINVPETGESRRLQEMDGMFYGAFMPPQRQGTHALQIRVRTAGGEPETRFDHRYLLRQPGEGVVQHVDATNRTGFFAVAVNPVDRTVWFGGQVIRFSTESVLPAGIVVQVDREGTPGRPYAPTLPAQAGGVLEGRITDIAIDRDGRLHFMFLTRIANGEGIVANGDLVLDRNLSSSTVFCQTVNALDPAYPFKDVTGTRPSPSIGARTDGEGNIWLYGSDGGVGRVKATFEVQGDTCQNPALLYDLPINRQTSPNLLTNSVFALVVEAERPRWFGTAIGLQNAQFEPVPFNPARQFDGDVTTLEAVIAQVAQAIFETRPIVTVDEVAGELIKGDLISSVIEAGANQLWAGTLGAGIRRIDNRGGQFQDALHIMRTGVVQIDANGQESTVLSNQGLNSNIIFALDQGPDGAIWVATPKGVSRIREENGTPVVTNFSALDGLAVDGRAVVVRDVAIGPSGIVWLATNGGMFRLGGQGQRIQGVVRDAAGVPIAGADVLIPGTAFRTVTDAQGRFALDNLPPGLAQIVIDGGQASGGPFASTCSDLEAADEEEHLEIVLPTEAEVDDLHLIEPGNTAVSVVDTQLPLTIMAENQDGPVAGAPVWFTVTEGPGTLTPACVTTDASGQATATLTIGSVGRIKVTASAAGLEKDIFTVNGVAEGLDVRLIRVSGNRQSVQPGMALPAPLIVRLIDQLGNPLVDAEVLAQVTRGEGDLTSEISAVGAPEQTALTDAQGLARFQLLPESSAADRNDLTVEVSALGQAVQFIAIVGEVDTPDIPLDLAVTGDVMFVADRRSGLRMIDVSTPETPTERSQANLDGTEVRLALAGNRLYAGTNFPLRLYALDLDLATDANSNVTGAVIGRVQLPDDVQRHAMTGVAVRQQPATPRVYAYVVTDARIEETGTLQVLDVTSLSTCVQQEDGGIQLMGRPRDIVVSGDYAYIPAGEAGLLIFDISDPMAPEEVAQLEGTFSSSMVLSNGFAYVVEETSQGNLFTTLDLSNPTAPRRRGTASTRTVTPVAEVAAAIAVDHRFAYLVQFASGLVAIDIQNPDAPREVGVVDTPSQALNVTISQDTLFVSDQIFGVQVIPGPGDDATDRDGDQTIDFFDAFPDDATEFRDTDGDGIGDRDDFDDDGDGHSDTEEEQAGTEPRDARSFPVTPPPSDATEIVVDASCPAQERNGTPGTPYCSISEGIQALNEAAQVGTLLVRPGTYSPVTTQETFPIQLNRLNRVTLRSQDPQQPDAAIIDAGFTGDVIFLGEGSGPEVTIEGFTLIHGAHGVALSGTSQIHLRQNRIVENVFAGVSLDRNEQAGNTITNNVIAGNGQEGIRLFQTSMTEIADNTIGTDAATNDGIGNGGVGIFVGLASNAEISGNEVINNGDDGIRVAEGERVTITGNGIHQNGSFNTGSVGRCTPIGNGIAASDTAVIITGNRVGEGMEGIEGNRLSGIVIQNSAATIANNRIEANGIRNRVRGDGVRIEDIQGVLVEVSNNIIHNNNREGIFVEDAQDIDVVISGNIISQNRTGILLDESSIMIANNTIEDNDSSGINFVSLETIQSEEAAEIINNVIRTNNIGIFLRSSPGAEPDITIANNDILGNTEEGIRIEQVSHTIINQNTIGQNKYGIFAIDSFDAMINIINNSIENNKMDGVLLDRAMTYMNGGRVANNGMVTNMGNDIGNGISLTNASTAHVGCEGQRPVVVGNQRAGIFVDRTSTLRIDLDESMLDGLLIEGTGQIEACPLP